MKKSALALALSALAFTPAFSAAETAAETAAEHAAHGGNAHAAAPAAAPAPAAKPLTAAQKAEVIELLGWFIALGQQPIQLEIFGFSSDELDILCKGIRSGAEGKNREKEFEKIVPQLRQLLDERVAANAPKMEAKRQAQLQTLKQENLDYLRKIDKEPGVQTTPSGLRYKIITPGAAEKPKPTSTVKVLYTGKLIDGTVFDSTSKRNNEPVSFQLDGVIPGWTEGLQKIGKGGKIMLYIPSDLAYRDEGSQGAVPPMATLTFEVELLDVTNEVKPAAPVTPVAPAGR